MVDVYIFTDSFVLSFYLIFSHSNLYPVPVQGVSLLSSRQILLLVLLPGLGHKHFWFGVVIFRKMVNVFICSIK